MRIEHVGASLFVVILIVTPLFAGDPVDDLPGDPLGEPAEAHKTEAKIEDFLRSIASMTGKSMIVRPCVDGRISGEFRGESTREILEQILSQVGARFYETNRTIHVFCGEKLPDFDPDLEMRLISELDLENREFSSPRLEQVNSTLPYFGYAPLIAGGLTIGEPFFGTLAEGVSANRLPYFGRRPRQMPSSHFTTPQLRGEREHE